jgi:glycopeptide antibiotics resistance protein
MGGGLSVAAEVPTKSPWIVRWAPGLLVIYVLFLGVVLLSPTSATQRWLVDQIVALSHNAAVSGPEITFSRVEILTNCMIFVPLVLLAAIVLPRVRWQDWTAYAFVASTLVESFQGFVLPHREASLSDIVANTSGALIGALLGGLVVKRLRTASDDSSPTV